MVDLDIMLQWGYQRRTRARTALGLPLKHLANFLPPWAYMLPLTVTVFYTVSPSIQSSGRSIYR